MVGIGARMGAPSPRNGQGGEVSGGWSGSELIVSVVIPTWQRALWLAQCLHALEEQTHHPNEVVVVGREEDVAAQAIFKGVADRMVLPVRWVEVKGPGHVAPIRRGLIEATGEAIAFLDDDTEPSAGWLAALLEPFSDPRVACVGGRVATSGFRGR